jgi:ADP-dependent phosphofructokinase/glucokinase
MINKLHKIKIEKGMMNTGILSNINNRIKQFKKSYLPLVFNGTNKKNKIKNIFKNEKPIRNIFRSKSCDKNIF